MEQRDNGVIGAKQGMYDFFHENMSLTF